jgi:hypothetical protein
MHLFEKGDDGLMNAFVDGSCMLFSCYLVVAGQNGLIVNQQRNHYRYANRVCRL